MLESMSMQHQYNLFKVTLYQFPYLTDKEQKSTIEEDSKYF